MAKTNKVVDIRIDGTHLICIQIMDKNQLNPYRIYREYNGHRRQLVKYGDFISVLYFVTEFFRDGLDSMTLQEQLEAIKSRTI